MATLKNVIRKVDLLEFGGGTGDREESVKEVVDDSRDPEAGEK